jgi:hypothetical protein
MAFEIGLPGRAARTSWSPFRVIRSGKLSEVGKAGLKPARENTA